MRGQRKNPRKAVQPFENKKRKIDIFKNYEANGVEKIQRKLEIFSTLISKKSIVDASNLERNLYLTAQLIEIQVPLIVAVNMLDVAKNHSISVDLDKLAQELVSCNFN